MRPVRKGAAYLYTDGAAYGTAQAGLAAKLGLYCSYCERKVLTGLEVEHIEPKSIHPALERVWGNFLLSCKNCNATKSDKNPGLHVWLIPDRDNTQWAYMYQEDGVIEISPELNPAQRQLAQETLNITGLNRAVNPVMDEQGNLVALDRRNQRLEIWLMALRYFKIWQAAPSDVIAGAIVDLAKAEGFFSIWMAAFAQAPKIRQRLINEFPGTEAACFDPVSTHATNTQHPNLDALAHGGKL